MDTLKIRLHAQNRGGGGILRATLRVFLAASIAITALAGEDGGKAQLEARSDEVRKQLGAEFTVVIEAPFVVAGNESPEVVKGRATSIVRWATDLLKKDYFAKDPDAVYAVYLFKDADCYNSQAEKLFGAKPISPYG